VGGHQPTIVNHTSVISIIPHAHAGVYHASKAASTMLTDTLRLKTKPFGIRVAEIKTGTVRSNFFENLKADANAVPKLLEGSVYSLAKEEIESCMRGKHTTGMAVESEGWAKQVVGSLVKRKPKAVIWARGDAWIVWLLTILSIPYTALDWQWIKVGRLKEQKGDKE
jgi:1-acylglycerone phosphate reductase